MPIKTEISELLNGAADFLAGRKLTSYAWLRRDDDSQVDTIPLEFPENRKAHLEQVAKACTMGAVKVQLMLSRPADFTDHQRRRDFETAAATTMMSNPTPEVQEMAAYYSDKFPPNHSRQTMLWTSDKIVEQHGEDEGSRIIVKWMRHAANA